LAHGALSRKPGLSVRETAAADRPDARQILNSESLA